MSLYWKINTHGDPLGAVRKLLSDIWDQLNLDSMLVSINGSADKTITPQLINNPEKLILVNPFNPIMTSNSAKLIPGLMNDNSDKHIGALLRPCESRALSKMIEFDSLPQGNLISICSDCLGTYPVKDYKWRSDRKGSSADLTRESLKFARQGSILPYRYRSACQLCNSPEADQADININVLGLPIRQYILVHSNKRKFLDKRIRFHISGANCQVGQ